MSRLIAFFIFERLCTVNHEINESMKLMQEWNWCEMWVSLAHISKVMHFYLHMLEFIYKSGSLCIGRNNDIYQKAQNIFTMQLSARFIASYQVRRQIWSVANHGWEHFEVWTNTIFKVTWSHLNMPYLKFSVFDFS